MAPSQPQLDSNAKKFLDLCNLGTADVDPIPIFFRNSGLLTLELIANTPYDEFQKWVTEPYMDDGTILLCGQQVTARMGVLYLLHRLLENRDCSQVHRWQKTDFNDWAHEFFLGRIDTASIVKAIGKTTVTSTVSSTLSNARDLLDRWDRAKRDCSTLMVFKNDSQF